VRALRIVGSSAGGKLEVRDLPTPSPGPGQVLVNVMAAGLNRGEINLVRRAPEGAVLPSGVEFAGVVADVGAGVRSYRAGDRVMGHGAGGHAEYMLAAELALMPVPVKLSWIEAAAFPNVFITAHDALITNGKMHKGEFVLVNAASSGIGLAAIQIAAGLGAQAVLATSRSPQKIQRLKEFGVSHPIDLSTEEQTEAVKTATEGRGVDVIVDSVGGSVFDANLRSLAVQGRLVNVGRMGGLTATIDLELLWLKRLRLIGVTFRTRSEEERLACVEACARDVLPLLAEGRIRLPVDRVFGLAEAAAAHAYMETNQHFGKIVFAVSENLQPA
jgi:NADPH:quinone reductase